ncbi:MAG: hypothetical protein H5T73_02510 [Actinobacteria bacterium]|nr:hypothetical protein [Actinomycetota bacterium]
MAERKKTKESHANVWRGHGPAVSRGGDEGGFAMLFVVFAIMVIGILGALLLLYTSVALRNAVGVTPASRALAAAETGLDVAHARLAGGSIEDSTTIPTSYLWDGKGSYTVTVTRNPDFGDGDPYDWKITSYGEYRANVEGVERTYYRTVEEVISFAGGKYYNALDYVLFSKEGKIDMNMDGDLRALNITTCSINGDIYAGKDVIVSNSSSLVGSNSFNLNGDIITEKGDVIIKKRARFISSSSLNINGDIYSGAMASSDSDNGGVLIENRASAASDATTNLVGNIHSRGKLSAIWNDSSFTHGGRGVSLCNEMSTGGIFFSHSLKIGITGNVYSISDVVGENNISASLSSCNVTTDIKGSVSSKANVTLDGSSRTGNVVTSHNINGSIYSGKDVTLNVNAHYGGADGGITVGGSVYCAGRFQALADSNAALGSSRAAVTIDGSLYALGNVNVNCDAVGLIISKARSHFYVKGGGSVINPPNLAGGFSSGGEMTLRASEYLNAEAILYMKPNARDKTADGPTIQEVGGGDVQEGTKTPPVSFSDSLPEPIEPLSYNEVLMPQCDFAYYAEEAKAQMEVDKDPRHYVTAPPGGEYSLTLGADDVKSSVYVVFCNGNLLINSVTVPVNTKAVLVATGNIRLRELSRQGAGDAEFQIIAKNKFYYDASGNMKIDDNDRVFIYAAHETYDPTTDPVSVVYEMGWFKNIYGQITARGDIVLNSSGSAFSWFPLANYSITYRNPSVLGEAFRIPFKVKSWKEL